MEEKRRKVCLTARELMILIDHMNGHISEFTNIGFDAAAGKLREKGYRVYDGHNSLNRQLRQNDLSLWEKVCKHKDPLKRLPPKPPKPAANDSIDCTAQLDRIEAKLDKLLECWDCNS